MKFQRILFVLGMAALALLTACGPAAAPTEAVSVLPPVEELPAVLPTPMPPSPEAAAPAATAAQYAPYCQSTGAATGCTAPTFEERDQFCVKKVPYTLGAVPAGSTYEVLTPGFTCTDSLTGKGELLLTCSGAELFTIDVKLCNPACAAPSLAMDTGQCPQEYGYDAANQCCAPAPSATAGEAGCVEVKVDIGTCPDPQ